MTPDTDLWEPTLHFRWFRKHEAVLSSMPGVLQQAWSSYRGHVTWRDIPVVLEGDETK